MSLALALISASLWGCGEPPETTEPSSPPVHVAVVKSKARTPSIEVTGTVQAERHATLRTESAGRVIEVPFRTGASVKAGEVLLRLDVSRSEIGVEQARARHGQAQAALRQARRAREDAEALSAQGANTPSLLQQARDREAEANARLEEAQAGVNAARANVSEATLTAPFDGVLANFRISEGEFVSPGTAVATLVDRSRLETELLVDAEEAAGARVGGEVVIQATRDRTFSGVIASVSNVLDPRTARLPVRIEIDDPEGTLLPGEVAKFELAVGEPHEALVLPDEAVIRRYGRTLVFVVNEGRAEARPVQVDRSKPEETYLLDGDLRSGDIVIVGGAERVEDGGAVRVVDDAIARSADARTPEGT